MLVEGGADTLGRFRDAGEIDEVHAFVTKIFGGRHSGPVGGVGVAEFNEAWSLSEWTIEQLGDDLLIHGVR